MKLPSLFDLFHSSFKSKSKNKLISIGVASFIIIFAIKPVNVTVTLIFGGILLFFSFILWMIYATIALIFGNEKPWMWFIGLGESKTNNKNVINNKLPRDVIYSGVGRKGGRYYLRRSKNGNLYRSYY